MRRLPFRLCVLAFALAMSVSAVEARIDILVDLSKQRMTVVKNRGDTVVWKISSGRPGFETPTGSYIVQRMDADHHSDEYDQAPMPWAIFFSRGLAIHGTYEGGLGRPRSHGCVRLAEPNARELFRWVEQYGATIEIVGGAAVGNAPASGGRKSRARPAEDGGARNVGEPNYREAPVRRPPGPVIDDLFSF